MITQCLRSLILDEPFFGSLALNLNIKPDPSIDTFATNGTDLLYSPDFSRTLTEKENTFVLAHEVLHCALGHVFRRDNRDPKLWNIACDYIVNAQLADHIANGSQAMTMPACAIHDTQYNGMSAEEIYAILSQNPPPASPPPATGTFSDPPPESDPDQQESEPMTEAEWKIITTQATNAQAASAQGNLPSNLERLIREQIDPSIPWTDLLNEFTTAITHDDYTWKRPNPRYAHTGFALPTLRTESLGDIIIAIDTSGSVGDKLLARFLAETQSLLDSAKPASITILSCDTSIHNPRTYHPGDTLTDYTPIGGGGTDFTPVFHYITDNEDSIPNPLALIYFTDGMGRFPSEEPHYPTLWLHHGHHQPQYPFGQIINIPPAQALKTAH